MLPVTGVPGTPTESVCVASKAIVTGAAESPGNPNSGGTVILHGYTLSSSGTVSSTGTALTTADPTSTKLPVQIDICRQCNRTTRVPCPADDRCLIVC